MLLQHRRSRPARDVHGIAPVQRIPCYVEVLAHLLWISCDWAWILVEFDMIDTLSTHSFADCDDIGPVDLQFCEVPRITLC